MLIGDCKTKEEVDEMKDKQVDAILAQLQLYVEDWDSEKCPATK